MWAVGVVYVFFYYKFYAIYAISHKQQWCCSEYQVIYDCEYDIVFIQELNKQNLLLSNLHLNIW